MVSSKLELRIVKRKVIQSQQCSVCDDTIAAAAASTDKEGLNSIPCEGVCDTWQHQGVLVFIKVSNSEVPCEGVRDSGSIHVLVLIRASNSEVPFHSPVESWLLEVHD